MPRSEEHTSELQSHVKLVCRLLLEKKQHCRRDQSRAAFWSPRLRPRPKATLFPYTTLFRSLQDFIEKLNHSPAVATRIEALKEELLLSETARKFSSGLWGRAKTALVRYAEIGRAHV